MKKEIIFVSGIDTAIGKSYATGFLTREWNREGIKTITQKFMKSTARSWERDWWKPTANA